MDGDFHSGVDILESTILEAEATSCAGAFFPHSQDFAVTGGIFTSNVTNNVYHAATPPADFRRIPLGDIDLRNEIRVKDSGVVERRHGRRFRRMYSARIHGQNSDLTVAVYQGNNEEEWRESIAKYSRLRHPNIFQIYGVASSSGIHAMVFHDDLLPFQDYLQLYRHSPILTVFIHGRYDVEFWDASHYVEKTFQGKLPKEECTFWMRRSTGRLCLELTPGEVPRQYLYSSRWMTIPDNTPRLDGVNPEARVIDSLEIQDFHHACHCHLSHGGFTLLPTHAEVNMGAVIRSASPQLGVPVEIASLAGVQIDLGSGWFTDKAVKSIAENGWIRYKSSEILGTKIRSIAYPGSHSPSPWLSQASHIFSRLQITSNYEDYVLVRRVQFQVEISMTVQNSPEGYLFLCPDEHLRTGASSLKWPNSPAYWSVDPSGAERLSTDDATRLGFPVIGLTTEVRVVSWNASVYAGLRQFHEAKGFDPDSQDVARHLGHELYRVNREMEVPFARIDNQVEDGEVGVTTKDAAEDESTSLKHAPIDKPHPQPQTLSPTGPLYDSHRTPPHPAIPMLIPPPLVPGPNLTIEEFCTKFNLDEDICTRFKSQKFKRTNALQYVELAGLKEMGFMPGEIAELRVAIAAWAQKPVPQ